MKFNCTEAERNIKLLQDNLKEGQTLEDVLQDNLLVVSAHHKLVKADKRKFIPNGETYLIQLLHFVIFHYTSFLITRTIF